MHEIICPHCQKAFKIDEAGYADILKQVRDSEFDEQLHERLKLAEKDKINAIELAKEKVSGDMQKAAADKDGEIQKLRAKLGASEVAQKHAVAEAMKVVEKERDALAAKLKQAKQDQKTASELANANHSNKLQETSAEKDAEIQQLKAKLSANEIVQKYAITEVVNEAEKERDKLKVGIERANLEKQLAETALKDKYETQLKDRDHEIDRLRDMKARLSTKMVGETLEQHCETEFNRIRATAFPTAYFEKDNDARTGRKGAYIFRDLDES
ncbi:MAG: DUF2130 domain-containing protein, partial [Gammaproteobacteria bacterium]